MPLDARATQISTNRHHQAAAQRSVYPDKSPFVGDIDGAIRKSAAWQADADLLASVPGVGKATLRTLIAELPELGRLDRRKIASPRRRRPYQSRQRRPSRPKDNRRRAGSGQDRPLYGRAHRKPRQPGHRRALSKTQS
jgi:hypothetical protein